MRRIVQNSVFEPILRIARRHHSGVIAGNFVLEM